jgi:hypothetical protein
MRVTLGMMGVLGFGLSVTVALAQPQPQGAAPVRGARLLPPQPLEPADTPVVARGAADDLPLSGNMTPVTRPGMASGTRPAGGPAWINGTGSPDAGVRTAAGTTGGASAVRPLTPKEDLSGFPKGIEKPKSPITSGQPKSQNGSFPPGQAALPRNTATAMSPFQGTAANGQPVYAGPPAYRWYGWGSVTPGANPIAPSGRYPIASANWYAITGATPGAIPVPVVNPSRPVPGTEPPAYVTAPGQRRPAVPAVNYATPLTYQPPPPPAYPADAEVLPPATIIPPPMPVTHAPDPAKPVSVPTISAPPAGGGPTTTRTEPEPLGARTEPLPVIASGTVPAADPVHIPLPVLPAAPSGLPVPPVATAPDGKPAPTPSPLPTSVTDDQNWQPGSGRAVPNEWNTPGGARPAPAPLPVRPQSRGNDGGAGVVARGQVDEPTSDPVAGLIRRLCDRRANGLDIRWTGTKKLTVAFASPTAAEAQKLVKEISARPELTPYQIDFSVAIK